MNITQERRRLSKGMFQVGGEWDCFCRQAEEDPTSCILFIWKYNAINSLLCRMLYNCKNFLNFELLTDNNK